MIAMRWWKAVAPLVALALMGCGGQPLETGPIDPKILHAVAAVHLDPASATAMLNAYRASHGLAPVHIDPKLMAMAQHQADAMIAANALSHNAGGSFLSRLASAGVDTTEAGENLGGAYYSSEEAMAGWRGSPEHNANLLIAHATRFGIAIAKDPRTQYRVYWAMEIAAEPQKPQGGTGLLTSFMGGQ
jgi:uncharacterized protein YkwD